MAAVLLACLSLAGVQDGDARARQLIERLGHDELAAREEAEQALVELGRAGLGALRRAARSDRNAEVRARAGRAAGRVMAGVAHEWAQQPPRRVTLRVDDVPLGHVLDEIERQTGWPYDAAGVDIDRRVGFAVTDVSLIEALDVLCRRHGALDYTRGPDWEYRLLPRARRDLPATYAGGHAVRLIRWETSRPFGEGRALAFEIVRERERVPIEGGGKEVTVKASDDTGLELKVASVFVGETVPGADRPRGSSHWALLGVPASAKHIHLHGDAFFPVAAAPLTVTFERIEEGLSKDAEGRTFTLVRRDCMLWVRVSDRKSQESVTLVGVDAQGRERPLAGEVSKDGGWRSLRVTLEGRMARMRVPYEMWDVPLP